MPDKHVPPAQGRQATPSSWSHEDHLRTDVRAAQQSGVAGPYAEEQVVAIQELHLPRRTQTLYASQVPVRKWYVGRCTLSAGEPQLLKGLLCL